MTRVVSPGSSPVSSPRRKLSGSNNSKSSGSAHHRNSNNNNNTRSSEQHGSTTYPLDLELQAEMRQFLGDSPMRFGPAVIPTPVNVREHLMLGSSLQLTTYVSLRTLSEVKKKYRKATNEQVLRIVQFCQFHDIMSYDLLKNSLPHYFHLTALDRQRDIEENRSVVPIPQLRLQNFPHSRVVYFRPSRFSPKHESKSCIIDSLIYILDNWTKHDALVWSKQDYTTSPVTYCLLVHLHEFEKSSNYSKEYWSKFMALLQGRVFPVKVGMVLWVDPPPCFEKVRNTMMQAMILSNTFAQKNFFLRRTELKDHLRPGFEDYLPRDEFPDLCPPPPPPRMKNPMDDAMTLGGMARDYLLFQRYLETLQGMSESHPTLSKKRSKTNIKDGRRRRRFSMPLKLTKKKKTKKKPALIGLESSVSGKEESSAVEESTGDFDGDDGAEEDDEDHDHYRDDEGHTGHEDDIEEENGDDAEEGEEEEEDHTSVNTNEKSVDSHTSHSKGVGGRIKKFRLRRKLKKDAKKKAIDEHYGYESTHPEPPPQKTLQTVNKSKTARRNSLNMEVGVGGKAVIHRKHRRSSLSVLEEMHRPDPEIDRSEAINAEPPSPSGRRRRRMSMKSMLAPLKIRRGKRGGGSSKSKNAKDQHGDNSSIDPSIMSERSHGGFNDSFDATQLASPGGRRPPRGGSRRHSSHVHDLEDASPSNNSSGRSINDDPANNNNFEDSQHSSNHEDSNDWSKLMNDMYRQSTRGLGLPSPRLKTPPTAAKAARRHSTAASAYPSITAPPFAEPSSPQTRDEHPPVAKKGQQQHQDLSYFLQQVERSKERTRQLQMQRKAGNTSVS